MPATLAGRGGEGVVSKLRKGFGLDNLDVKTDAAGGASLTAGKYLTKNIYSEVTVDQDGKSQINLNLDLSKTITLRGRANSDGSAGEPGEHPVVVDAPHLARGVLHDRGAEAHLPVPGHRDPPAVADGDDRRRVERRGVHHAFARGWAAS